MNQVSRQPTKHSIHIVTPGKGSLPSSTVAVLPQQDKQQKQVFALYMSMIMHTSDGGGVNDGSDSSMFIEKIDGEH